MYKYHYMGKDRSMKKKKRHSWLEFEKHHSMGIIRSVMPLQKLYLFSKVNYTTNHY